MEEEEFMVTRDEVFQISWNNMSSVFKSLKNTVGVSFWGFINNEKPIIKLEAIGRFWGIYLNK